MRFEGPVNTWLRALPVVANPFGASTRAMVLPESTGFLAESPTEWADAIERLAKQLAALCAGTWQMPRGGNSVNRTFTVSVWGPRLVKILAALDRSSE